jgi:hypothetical protein
MLLDRLFSVPRDAKGSRKPIRQITGSASAGA